MQPNALISSFRRNSSWKLFLVGQVERKIERDGTESKMVVLFYYENPFFKSQTMQPFRYFM